MCAKLCTVAESNNRVHPTRSLCYCLFAPHIYGCCSSCNTNREVATTSLPFYNEPHRSHILFVKVSHSMTFTSWSQYHFVAIGKHESHVCKASHCGSKHQQSLPNKITLLLLVRTTCIWVLFFAHIPFMVKRTFNVMDNGLLFHMTQSTNSSNTRNHCTMQTSHNSEH